MLDSPLGSFLSYPTHNTSPLRREAVSRRECWGQVSIGWSGLVDLLGVVLCLVGEFVELVEKLISSLFVNPLLRFRQVLIDGVSLSKDQPL